MLSFPYFAINIYYIINPCYRKLTLTCFYMEFIILLLPFNLVDLFQVISKNILALTYALIKLEYNYKGKILMKQIDENFLKLKRQSKVNLKVYHIIIKKFYAALIICTCFSKFVCINFKNVGTKFFFEIPVRYYVFNFVFVLHVFFKIKSGNKQHSFA